MSWHMQVMGDPHGRGWASWNATTAYVDAVRIKPSITSCISATIVF